MHVENVILIIFHCCQENYEKGNGEFKYPLGFLSSVVIDGLKTKMYVEIIQIYGQIL